MKITELISDSQNANKGTQRGLKELDKSLRRNGAGRSILIDAHNRIIAGNKTVDRAADIGLDDVIVVETDGTKLVAVKRTDLDLEQGGAARELAYADNWVGQIDLDWDADQVLADLEAGGAELQEMLKDLAEYAGIDIIGEQAEDPGAQIDKADELREKWQTETGQLWQVGAHRVICGDCRRADVWTKLLDGQKANGIFTSPPYAEQRKNEYGGVPVAEYVEWWNDVQANARINIAANGSFFLNIKPHCEDGQRVLYVFDLVLSMVRAWGWRFVDELCWTHEAVPGKWDNRFKNGFEPVYQFCVSDKLKFRPLNVSVKKDTAFKGKGGGLHSYYDPNNLIANSGRNYFGDVLPSNVLKLHSPSASTEFTGHGAQFPEALPEFFVQAYSDEQDIWLDPFLGSGTTLVACERLGRKGRGIEISPSYVAVTLERLAGTGLTPELVS